MWNIHADGMKQGRGKHGFFFKRLETKTDNISTSSVKWSPEQFWQIVSGYAYTCHQWKLPV